MTDTFKRATVTIDDVSEPGAWASALVDRALSNKLGQPLTHKPPVDEKSYHHGEGNNAQSG